MRKKRMGRIKNMGTATMKFGEGIIISGSADANSISLIASGSLSIEEYIYHIGDPDTYIQFGDDQMILHAGGRSMLKLEEAGTDKLIVNHGGLDIDFQVKGSSHSNLIRTDAANDRVGISTNSPTCTFSVNGSYAGKVAEVTSFQHTVQADSWLISCGGSGSRTINLPAASSNTGRVLIIKDETGNVSSGNITIDGNSNENIDGSTTYVMNQDKSCITLVCTGQQWIVTSVYSGPPP